MFFYCPRVGLRNSQLILRLQIRFNPLFAATGKDSGFLPAAVETIPKVHLSVVLTVISSSDWLVCNCGAAHVRLPREHHPLHEAPGGGSEADVLCSQGHRQHGAGEQVCWRWRIIPKHLARIVFMTLGVIYTGADLLLLIWKCLAWMTTTKCWLAAKFQSTSAQTSISWWQDDKSFKHKSCL